ncbi:hypothetical protein AB9K35_19075 [Leisingera sp. XS_AS12]|uniref:hypothetical protein n=1 Tax=Leisingera sp. XS_AS12 TaxID=3241294 RepID=UPI003515BF03
MSYQPEPDPEKEYPRLFALKHRVIAWKAQRPIAFWFWVWIVCTGATLLGFVGGSEHQMQRPSTKLFALYAALGWIYPFYLWVKARTHRT